MGHRGEKGFGLKDGFTFFRICILCKTLLSEMYIILYSKLLYGIIWTLYSPYMGLPFSEPLHRPFSEPSHRTFSEPTAEEFNFSSCERDVSYVAAGAYPRSLSPHDLLRSLRLFLH